MMKHKIKELIIKLTKTGFFSIYLSTICSKVITLFGGIFIVRILSKEDYGIYTLVLNAISMLCVFGDFGVSNATMQYAIEAEKDAGKQKGFFLLGIKMMIISSVLSSILILLSSFFYPYQSKMVEKLTIIMLGIPILTSIINYIGTILRVKRKNNKYSLYQILNTIVHYTIIISFSLMFGLHGSLLAQYIYNIIILIIGCVLIKKDFSIRQADMISKKDKKGFWKIALGSQLSNTLNSLLYTVDIFIIGVMGVQSTDVSIYKVATIIPTALVFLPQCLSIYIFPYFISHNKDSEWVKKNTIKIIKYTSPIYGIISIGGILMSKIIVYILYGIEYMGAVIPFSILMIGFFFSATIKNLLSNVIYSFHKIGFSVFLNILSIIINIILDIIFIKLWGSVGVAISTMIVNVITATISIAYFKICIKNLEKENLANKNVC